jgi:hypothetical protein
MRIGLVADGLPDLALPDLLRTAAELGIATLEFGCGNWSAAPHLKLDALLDSVAARDDFLAALAAHGLSISALNCSGNPLHPGEHGRAHRAVTSKTIRLAGLLGVSRVVLMSGCPGGPGDANANWITTAWPPEAARVLEWQWSEQVIPYWHGLVREAGGERDGWSGHERDRQPGLLCRLAYSGLGDGLAGLDVSSGGKPAFQARMPDQGSLPGTRITADDEDRGGQGAAVEAEPVLGHASGVVTVDGMVSVRKDMTQHFISGLTVIPVSSRV